MSFGWGAGDVVLAIQFAKSIYDALTESTDEYNTFAIWLRSLVATLELFQIYETTEDQSLNALLGSSYTPQEVSELHDVVPPLKTNVDRFLTTLKRYILLSEKPEKINILDWCKRQGKKLQWSFLEAEDLRTQKNEVSQHLGMLHAIVSARALRNVTVALSSLSDKADANHRALMNFVSDTNKTASLTHEAVMTVLNVVCNSILASGEVPNMRPMAPSMGAIDPTSDAKSILHLLEQQVPTASWRPSYDVDSSAKIGFYARDILESWLEPRTNKPCLWIVDEQATRLSHTVVVARREEHLPVVHYHCERLDADGKLLEPEQILSRLSYSVLHQLLCYIVDRQLPMPSKLDVDDYKDLEQDPVASTNIIGLASSLVDGSSRIMWVIDEFERLEDDLLPMSEPHKRAVEKLLTQIGVNKPTATPKNTQLVRRCLVATKTRSKYLVDASINSDLEMFAPAERADPERYVLMDELKGMMLWEKEKLGTT